MPLGGRLGRGLRVEGVAVVPGGKVGKGVGCNKEGREQGRFIFKDYF
jgi:hypothetical protein